MQSSVGLSVSLSVCLFHSAKLIFKAIFNFSILKGWHQEVILSKQILNIFCGFLRNQFLNAEKRKREIFPRGYIKDEGISTINFFCSLIFKAIIQVFLNHLGQATRKVLAKTELKYVLWFLRNEFMNAIIWNINCSWSWFKDIGITQEFLFVH